MNELLINYTGSAITPFSPPAGGSLEAYIQEVNKIPLLTAEEEQNLAVQLKEQENLQAAKQLVLSNLRFVVYIARGYMGYGLALSDLIQEGNVGLMKAVKRFDPDQGVRLVSFAVHWIRAEIHEFILRNWRIVKVATTKAQRKLFFNLRKAKTHLGWLSREEIDTVAKDLGVSPEAVVEMESRLSNQDVAFDGPIIEGEEDEEAARTSPVAYLTDPNSDPALQAERMEWETLGVEHLHQALANLDERSRDILTRRWLVENKATLHDLATEYHISAERIRQLEKNALNKLRKQLELARPC